MGVSVLLRLFINSNEVSNTAYALLRIHEQNSIFKCTIMGPMISKETKYKLHYGKVQGEVLPPSHATNTSCSVEKINVKKIAFGNKEHTTDQKWESRFYWESS